MGKKIIKSIKGGQQNIPDYLRDLWKAKKLIYIFAARDLKVQYAQTFLGLLWSVIQPLTALAIFSLFFQRVVHLQLNAPYTAFVFTGILGWFYFTSLVGQAGTSLMHNQQLIRKIHFPRMVLPLSKALAGLVEFGISLLILIVVLVCTKTEFSYKIILLPIAILANIIAGLSVGIWLSALTIRFRDLHHLIPFLIGFGIWLTPVFYPVTIVPERFSWIYYLHPAASVIALYRFIFLNMPMNEAHVFISLALATGLLVTGFIFFVRNEKFISDYI